MDHPLEHELTRHAAALRSMAHALVHPGDVDDLVQDVALQVLRKPPARPGRLGGLLMTILRQLASKRRRGEARRRQREQQAAKPEATAPAEQPLEQNEMVERLLRELLALPQPYREVLLQRFFEDRWPAQIAAGARVPVETVKTRIKRGLSLLRERLDADGEGKGEWRALLAGAFGLGRGAAVAAGVVLMGTGLKVALGGVAAAAVAVAAWWTMQPAAPVAPPVQVARQDVPSPAVADVDTKTTPTEAPAPERRELAPPSSTLQLATIRGRCVDLDGHPVAGISAYLFGKPREERLPTFEGKLDWHDPPAQATGADGRFAFTFAPPPPYRFTLTLHNDHQSAGYTRWDELAAGQTIDLGDLPVFAHIAQRARVVDTNGAPLARVHVQPMWTPSPGLHTPLELSAGTVERTDAAGDLRWWNLLPGTYRLEVQGRDIVRGAEFELVRGQAEGVHEIVVAAADAASELAGTVVDDDGAPVGNITVHCDSGEQRLSQSTYTDRLGRFHFVRRPEDRAAFARFDIDADGYEASRPDQRFDWGRTDVRLQLSRGVAVEVLAIDAARQPVTSYRVWVVPDQAFFHGGSFLDIKVRSDGQHPGGLATITGLRRGPYFVVVQPADADLATNRPVRIEAGDRVARAVVQLRSAPRRLLRVLRKDGTAVSGSRIRLVDPTGTEPCIPGNAESMPGWAYYTVNGTLEKHQPLPILLQEATTDERGEAILRGVDDQPVTVSVQGALHCPTQLDSVRLADADPLVITVTSGATLTGTTQPEVVRALRELAGLPPTGEVTELQRRGLPALNLQRGDARYPETYPAPGRFVHFDADGAFTFERVPPGSWPLVLHTYPNPNGGEHTEVVATVLLRDGETTTLPLDFGALLPAELSGRVLWNDQPLDASKATDERVSLRVTTTDLAGKPYEYWSTLQTDADGRFTWRGRAGTVQLHKTMILPADETIVVRPGAKVERDFHGRSGILRILAVDGDGVPVEGFELELFDAAGTNCPPLPPTGADGHSQREIGVGTFRVEARPRRLLDYRAAAEYARTHGAGAADPFASVRLHLGEVTVTAGQTTEATLRLPAEWSR